MYKNLLSKADGRLNKKQLEVCLLYMESRLSKSGFEILINWLEGSSNGGWNRWNTLMKLSSFFGLEKYSKTRPHYLLKSDLVSYTNRDLLGLVNLVDLIEINGKFYTVK